jgi:hypothetical protein
MAIEKCLFKPRGLRRGRRGLRCVFPVAGSVPAGGVRTDPATVGVPRLQGEGGAEVVRIANDLAEYRPVVYR